MKEIDRFTLTLAALAAMGCLVAAPVQAQPFVATAGSAADVCTDPNQVSCTRGTLYVVNGATHQVQGSTVVWQGDFPHSWQKLVAHPGGAFVYAAHNAGSSPALARLITVIDLRTMSAAATYTVTGSLAAISPDGARLYLTTPDTVVVIDSATGGVLSSIPASAPLAVAVSPNGERLYIAQSPWQAASIAVVDAVTHAPVATIPLTNSVHQLELTADGSHLYALTGSRILDIDTASNTIAGVITDFGGPTLPHRFSIAGGRAYVAASFPSPDIVPGEGIAVIDIATRTLVTKIEVFDAYLVEASTDGSRVWTRGGDLRLTTIDAVTNQVVDRSTAVDLTIDLVAIPSRRHADIAVDQPAASAVVQQPFSVSGWAVDVMGVLPGPGVSTVHVWAFPAGGGAPTFVGADYGRPRPDVGALFGPSFTNSGYSVSVRGLTPGAYQLIAFALSVRTGQFSIARAVAVTIGASARLVVETPQHDTSVSPRFTIAGWAIDAAAATGTGIDAVHVWAYPQAGGAPLFAGAATLGDARSDVAALYGVQFANAGYHLEVSTLAPGSYTLVLYGHSTVTRAFSVEQHIRVTIPVPQPLMWVDIPATSATVGTTFVVAGWAVELNAATGTGVDLIHIWATSPSGAATFLGTATYGTSRPDVGAWLGPQYSASGFGLVASLSPGTYTVSVYARSSATGTFRQWQTVQITVQ